MKVMFPAVMLGFTAAAQAAVYGPGTGGAIPDNPSATCTAVPPTVLTSTIAIADAGTVASVNSVTLTGLTHTWVGDIVVTLTAPNGDTVHVMARTGPTGGPPGSASDAGGNYVFQNAPTVPTFSQAAAASPVPSGTYGRFTTTVGPPAADPDTYDVFAGDPVTGNWTLAVADWCAADLGSFTSWSLDITLSGGNPCPANVATGAGSQTDVDVDDLLAIISAWGPCGTPCPANVATGAGSETDVDVDDLLAVIGAWGPCPAK
jgi:subtilisin-like proprotein convertase family protein